MMPPHPPRKLPGDAFMNGTGGWKHEACGVDLAGKKQPIKPAP